MRDKSTDTNHNQNDAQHKHVKDYASSFDKTHYIDHDNNGWWTVHEGSESCFDTVSVAREDDAVAEWLRIMSKAADEKP